ncbi:FGGY family carbohydrate kinase [Labilibaculum manganireducens]|uniref:FGGY-family carbohydrate kinase n=1 Tax=Labilibaculum manganireducens TaxID=1940525 RepID=UPI0029F4F001|nr:FGGY family carbohydrate kinase [Labilibaculum manganireducens]
MEIKVIAVFDIGKTNKKILLFDQVFNLVYQYEEKFSTTVDDDGFECDDIQLIQNWMVNTLSVLVEEGKFDIQAINFSTYGASLAFLNKEGKLVTPIYNYLKQVNPEIQESLFQEYGGMDEFCRQTASPALGLLLNSGIQALWLKKEKQDIWEKVENALHFPQYLSFVLTRQITSEPTSIGCHTFMWDFDKMQYHPWLKKEGLKLPKPVNNDQVYPALIKGKEIKTGVGIHDSSASLVPYLHNSKEDFILVSTGTWCISMNPFNDEPLTSEQLKNDCLCFLTPEKRQVKSSRLFMGHFHETCIARLNHYFNASDKYFQNIDYCEDAVNSINLKFGRALLFFPEGIEKFSEGLEKVDLSVFADYDEAYTRLVMELTQLSVRSIELVIPKRDTTKTIYVSGGFSRNKIFVSLLTNYFTDKKVRTSEIDNASALGAALVIAGNIEGFTTNKIELESK